MKNEKDARLFEHYATTQLALVDLAGKVKPVGAPDLFIGARLAPGGKLMLTQALRRPFSYIVPASDFPRRIEVRDLAGKQVHLVAERPLEEGLPPGNDAVSKRRARRVMARRCAGHPGVGRSAGRRRSGAQGRGARHRLRPGRAVCRAAGGAGQAGQRYNGVQWGRGDLALLTECWYKTRAVKTWRIAPDQPAARRSRILPIPPRTATTIPASPVTQPDAAGLPRLVIGADTTILLDGAGASAEGDRPFIDRFNLTTQNKQRLFQSAPPYFENPVAVLDAEGSQLLTTRESPTERPNYYIRDLRKPGDGATDGADRLSPSDPAIEGCAEGADPLPARRRRRPDGHPDAAAGLRAASAMARCPC